MAASATRILSSKSGATDSPARTSASSAEKQAASLVGVVLEVLGEAEPVGGLGPVGRSAEGREQLHRLRGGPDGVDRSVDPTRRLGQRPEQLCPNRWLGVRRDQRLVGVDGLPDVARGQAQVGLEAGPGGVRVRQQLGRGRPEATGDEVEGGHRRLRGARLEGADVRLRVAAFRQPLLAQAGAMASLSDPTADRLGEGRVVDDDPAACPGAHGAQCTPTSTPD